MSDKKQQNTEKSEGRQEQWPWLWKQQTGRGQQQKKKDPEEIPILQFGPNNNFAKFKEALANKALREYGDLGRLIKSSKYFIPEPPDVTDYDLVSDPYGLNKASCMEKQKMYMRHWEDMNNKGLSSMPWYGST